MHSCVVVIFPDARVCVCVCVCVWAGGCGDCPQLDVERCYSAMSALEGTAFDGLASVPSLAALEERLHDGVGSMWRDFVCGDGVCEPPYEFPAFGSVRSLRSVAPSFSRVDRATHPRLNVWMGAFRAYLQRLLYLSP
jgi:hypothetical protein